MVHAERQGDEVSRLGARHDFVERRIQQIDKAIAGMTLAPRKHTKHTRYHKNRLSLKARWREWTKSMVSHQQRLIDI